MVHLATRQRPTAAGESHAHGRGGYTVVRGQRLGIGGGGVSLILAF